MTDGARTRAESTIQQENSQDEQPTPASDPTVTAAKSADLGTRSKRFDHTEAAADPVEVALGDALTRASLAGQWDVVGQLARELEARRKARWDVVDLKAARERRGGKV